MAKDIVMKRFLLLITVGLGLLAPAYAQKADVILTTDCGTDVDDQWMIVYLLLSPEFNVKGIVTTHAPNLAVPQAETSANCVRDVVKRLGIPAPPIFAGSSTRLKDRTPLRNDGVDFMVKTARQYSATHRLAIFTIGAATDVGSAFLADPGLENRVEILSMGFNSWPKGGDGWNIKNDPLAYSVILESSAPVTIGAADICKQYLKLDAKTANQMVGDRGSVGKWLAEIFGAFVVKYKDLVTREVAPQSWVIWDDVVLAHLLKLTEYTTYPRPELNLENCEFTQKKTGKTIRWITKVDEKRMWADFLAKLDRHNRAAGVF